MLPKAFRAMTQPKSEQKL